MTSQTGSGGVPFSFSLRWGTKKTSNVNYLGGGEIVPGEFSNSLQEGHCWSGFTARHV